MSGRMRLPLVLFLASFLLVSAGATNAQLTPPAGPANAASARYTLGDIWNRLTNGAPGAPRAGAFLEPAAGPATVSTKTTNEIMAAAPAADNTNGATAANVLTGKTFWGLRTSGGTWGLQGGTMLNRGAVSIMPGQSSQPILAGYHNGSGTVLGDSDLRPSVIVDGVELFGVAGTAIVATGTAVAWNVLSGATFSNATAAGLTGTMVNRGAVTITPGTTEKTITVGYHNGSGTVAGDADLVAGNIKSGVAVFGVSGTVLQATGDAAVANVLAGKTFSNAGAAGLTGTMANRGAVNFTPGTAQQAILAGYHDGSGVVYGDTDLVAGNIKSGVYVFGVQGTHPLAGVPKTGQQKCWKFEGGIYVEDVGCVTNIPGGQDGKLQKGIAWPNPRFTDSRDGTVTDNLTGLIWLKDANCYAAWSWNNALAAAALLNSGECGLTDGSAQGDWRLPNRRELLSLIHDGFSAPALPDTSGSGQWTDGDPFTNVAANWNASYWTSTTHPAGAPFAWVVSFGGGSMEPQNKDFLNRVWPVRGGQ